MSDGTVVSCDGTVVSCDGTVAAAVQSKFRTLGLRPYTLRISNIQDGERES